MENNEMKIISIDETKSKVIVDESFIKLLLNRFMLYPGNNHDVYREIKDLVDKAYHDSLPSTNAPSRVSGEEYKLIMLNDINKGIELMRYLNDPIVCKLMSKG